jgi:hypothetical protein
MKTRVEAEGGELILRNTFGDVAIIPKDQRGQALSFLSAGEHGKLDGLISGLPGINDFAEEGTIIPNTPLIKNW